MAKKAVRKPSTKKVVKLRKTAQKAAGKKASVAAARGKKARPAGESLGRPLVTAEEKLYLLFKEDYHARQIFEFLRVETVGELEQFSPQQIIQILSTPVRKTVDRIREKLAANKRRLRDDTEFAREYLTARKGD